MSWWFVGLDFGEPFSVRFVGGPSSCIRGTQHPPPLMVSFRRYRRLFFVFRGCATLLFVAVIYGSCSVVVVGIMAVVVAVVVVVLFWLWYLLVF